MTLQAQYELVRKAIERNELTELFLGSPGYEWGELKHIPAKVATDIGAIMENGIYVSYKNGDSGIPQKLKSTVYELMNGTPVEIWTAYSICWIQYWNEQRNISPFSLFSQDIQRDLHNAVIANRDQLIACKELIGWNKKEGLWEDITISNQNFKKRFGVEII